MTLINRGGPRSYILSMVAVTLSAGWAIWGFVNDMTAASFLSLGFRGTIDFFITSFHVSEIVGSGFYFVASAKFKEPSLVKIFDNFDEIDKMVPARGWPRRLAVTTFLVLTFMVVLYVLDVFMWGMDSWSGVNNYFGYYIMYTIGIVHEVRYWNIVALLYDRIRALNDLIRAKRRYQFDRNYQFLADIIKVHDLVTETAQTVNTCFGNSTSLIILSSYINLVVCPYVLFVMLSSNKTNFFNFVYFIWIFVQISRLLVVVNSCHRCQHESGKTSSLIFKLLTKEKRVGKEFGVLLFKVSRSKMRFTSYGLKKLDRGLILSVITTISTYWMILVQFSARFEA